MTLICFCESYRIVCEMGKAESSQFAGNVQVCVGECHPEFMAKSSKYYYFVVSSFCSHGDLQDQTGRVHRS